MTPVFDIFDLSPDVLDEGSLESVIASDYQTQRVRTLWRSKNAVLAGLSMVVTRFGRASISGMTPGTCFKTPVILWTPDMSSENAELKSSESR